MRMLVAHGVTGHAAITELALKRQGTPGKLVLGLSIVDAETGQTPRLGRLVLRYLGYLLSTIPLGLGYFWMLWDDRRQTWHDKLGGTLVVVTRRGDKAGP